MKVNFQITKSFAKDLKKFGINEQHVISDQINKYGSILTQRRKVRSRQLYQPYQIELTGNLDSSLYVLKVARNIRVILAIDEDPIFDQFLITLLRVVKADEAEQAYMDVSQSLYQPLFAQAQ